MVVKTLALNCRVQLLLAHTVLYLHSRATVTAKSRHSRLLCVLARDVGHSSAPITTASIASSCLFLAYRVLPLPQLEQMLQLDQRHSNSRRPCVLG